jgi:hypothetical protein
MSNTIDITSLVTDFGLSMNKLVDKLEENFPPVNPHPDDSSSLIMYRSGQRSVVEWIKYQLTEENNG